MGHKTGGRCFLVSSFYDAAKRKRNREEQGERERGREGGGKRVLSPNQWRRNPFPSHPEGVRSSDIGLGAPSVPN